jgi:arabinose-5-phosphate isomerase
MNEYADWGRDALDIELESLQIVRNRLGAPFTAAVRAVKNCKGKVIVTGLGKSGHIGGKMAATFASLGTPSFFMHSTEALHGDSGMMEAHDIMIAISYSGTTKEVLAVAGLALEAGLKLITMTKSCTTPLGGMSDICLEICVPKEADPLGLAPTSSSTVTLALGDALAVAVSRANNFKTSDFASRHPQGALGKKAKRK